MNGKIDKMGALCIERAGKMKNVLCYIPDGKYDDGSPHCGHWCALFGEPESPQSIGMTRIELCHKELYFQDFTDERKP